MSGGCRAIFSSFGMQKTVTQLEILRVVLKHKGGKGLIVCPKRVVVEFLTNCEELFLYAKAIYSAMIWGREVNEQNRIIQEKNNSVK